MLSIIGANKNNKQIKSTRSTLLCKWYLFNRHWKNEWQCRLWRKSNSQRDGDRLFRYNITWMLMMPSDYALSSNSYLHMNVSIKRKVNSMRHQRHYHCPRHHRSRCSCGRITSEIAAEDEVVLVVIGWGWSGGGGGGGGGRKRKACLDWVSTAVKWYELLSTVP